MIKLGKTSLRKTPSIEINTEKKQQTYLDVSRNSQKYQQIFQSVRSEQSNPYEQTHNNKKQQAVNSKYEPKNNGGQEKIVQFLNGPRQGSFMKYYEENIKLKKQLEDRKNYIQELRRKLQLQMNMNKTTNPYVEVKQLKQQTKKVGPPRSQSTNKKGGKSFYNTMTGGGQTKKVQNLLQIIDHYKNKLMLADEESANLRRQKLLLQQDLQVQGKGNILPSQNNDSMARNQVRKQEDLGNRLRQKSSQLQLERQKNKYVQAQLRRLQIKIKMSQMDRDQLQQMKVSNRVLQERVLKMTLLSDNAQEYDRRATEDKAKELEMRVKVMMQKYNRLKDQKTKFESDYRLQSNKLIQLVHDNQELEAKVLQLKKNEINDPVIRKLIKDKDLLARVVGQIQKPKGLLGPQVLNSFQTAQNLILQKQQLARQLIDTRNKLSNMQQTWRQKQTMNKIQKQQMMSMLSTLPDKGKSTQYTSKQGVPYDGDISMFSDEKIGNAAGLNYFDIYLGNMSLIQALVRNSISLSSNSNPLIMATVDFYNFSTVNTKLTQGLVGNLNSEFTFKISEDQFFYKYLNKESFKISIWASQGNKQHHLGSVEVPLKQLFLKNKPRIAPVINTSAPIILSQKVIGTLNFDMRMRLPIYEQTQSLFNASMLVTQAQQPTSQAQKRKLIIQIQQGHGFPSNSNLFVYYPFRLQDYYTKTSKGPQPKWGHYKMVDVIYNEEFKNYLKRNQLQFTVFDDNAVLYNQKDTDVLGSAVMGLVELLDSSSGDKAIRKRLQIKKNGSRIGEIDVKVFWYQSKDLVQNKQIVKNQKLIDTMHADFIKYINQNNSNSQIQFKKIDRNGTGLISWDQFYSWSTKVKKSHKYSQQLISKYYETFKQPLNLINWDSRLRQRQRISEEQPQDFKQQLGMINQILQKNSVQISQKVSLRDYLRGKQLFNVYSQIDVNRDGTISRQQMMQYMKKHNILLDQHEIQGDRIKVMDFLRKYSN